MGIDESDLVEGVETVPEGGTEPDSTYDPTA
jgi:hypothetical protein